MRLLEKCVYCQKNKLEESKMKFEMLYAKLHRATITDVNLNYVGSITIDEDLLDLAHLREI